MDDLKQIPSLSGQRLMTAKGVQEVAALAHGIRHATPEAERAFFSSQRHRTEYNDEMESLVTKTDGRSLSALASQAVDSFDQRAGLPLAMTKHGICAKKECEDGINATLCQRGEAGSFCLLAFSPADTLLTLFIIPCRWIQLPASLLGRRHGFRMAAASRP